MLTWWCSVLVWTRWTQGLFQSNWFCQLTTRAWSQQLELPPVLTPLMSSSTVVSTRSSSASHLVGLSNTWTRKLSLMHPRILLDFLQLDVLLSWQMPGWLKSSAGWKLGCFLHLKHLDLGLTLIRPPPAGVLCWSCLWFFYPQALNLFVLFFRGSSSQSSPSLK